MKNRTIVNPKYYLRNFFFKLINLINQFYQFVVTGILFVGSLILFPVVGFSLFPKSEKPQFLINVEMPNGTVFMQPTKWLVMWRRN